MFSVHPDSMPPESTPERVFSLVKLASIKPSSREELNAKLVMKDLFGVQHQDVFAKTIKCADELALISDNDGIVGATELFSELSDYKSFRKYVTRIIFNRLDTTFFKVTEWYLAQNDKVYTMLNWESVAAQIDRDGINIRENDMLGWRWWVSFMGLGYLHGAILISNLAVRLNDCFEDAGNDLPKGETVTATKFLKYLDNLCPETKNSRIDRTLGLGVSNGLRVLFKNGRIDLLSQRDAERINLFPIEGLKVNDFSHVIFKG